MFPRFSTKPVNLLARTVFEGPEEISPSRFIGFCAEMLISPAFPPPEFAAETIVPGSKSIAPPAVIVRLPPFPEPPVVVLALEILAPGPVSLMSCPTVNSI